MEINNLNRIDLDTVVVNYVDSAVSNRLKLKSNNGGGGVGEKRIYITTTETDSSVKEDDFFFRDTSGMCFILKDDLLIYLRDAYYEYMYPTQDYKYQIGDYYNELISNVNSLPQKIDISFYRTHDSRKRYYLVCERKYRKEFNILSEICLPRITRLSFVKFIDGDNETHIQLRPYFFRTDLTGSRHPRYNQSIGDEQIKEVVKIIEEVKELEVAEDIEDKIINLAPTRANDRPWQSEWRSEVLEETMHCAISKCSDDRILIGCHIKPVTNCLKDKCGNERNPKNGIMMTPTYHKLFDDGFLSFDNQNHLLLSTHISSRNYARISIANNQTSSILDLEPRIEFLDWHRKWVFKG